MSAPLDDPTDRILVGKPPPIIIDDTWDSDYFDRYERYNTGLTYSLECKLAGRGDSLILRCKNYTDYNVLLSNLRRNNEPFTTQTPKHEKSTRLVATRLPIGISTDRVMSELQAKNTKISASYRITAPDREKGGTKSLTAVVCTFPPGTPLHAVSSAAPTIAGCAVRWHPFDTKGEPVQCFRCQDFNHTSRNCNRLEKCRRCSRHHASKNCDTPTEVRCANCGESHPTNYRGCGYYKHIKQTNVSKRAATIKPPHPSPLLPVASNPKTEPTLARTPLSRRPSPQSMTPQTTADGPGSPPAKMTSPPLPAVRWAPRRAPASKSRPPPAPRPARQQPWWKSTQAQKDLQDIEARQHVTEQKTLTASSPPPPPLSPENYPSLPSRPPAHAPQRPQTRDTVQSVLAQISSLSQIIPIRSLPPSTLIKAVCELLQATLSAPSPTHELQAVTKFITYLSL